jgi:hypothetical protein
MSKVDEILDDLSSPELKAYRDIDKAKSSLRQMIEGLSSYEGNSLSNYEIMLKKDDVLNLFK